MKLPLDIRSIVYRYLYSTVLDELRVVYGTPNRLKCILVDKLCKRINDDAMNYGTKAWRCAYTGQRAPSDPCVAHWLSSWNKAKYSHFIEDIS